MNTRAAHAVDTPAIAALCAQLGYPASQETVARRLERVLGDERHAVFVAEEPDGKVAGWVHVCERLLVLAEPQAAIEGLVVDQAQRRQGMGRLLMERAEQWARSRGCTAVVLRSNVERRPAHLFYEDIGYRHYKSQRAYLRELPDDD